MLLSLDTVAGSVEAAAVDFVLCLGLPAGRAGAVALSPFPPEPPSPFLRLLVEAVSGVVALSLDFLFVVVLVIDSSLLFPFEAVALFLEIPSLLIQVVPVVWF